VVKAFAEFGLCFSSGGRPCPGSSPSIPNGKILGTTRLDGQYSRPSTFYQQLQTLNPKLLVVLVQSCCH